MDYMLWQSISSEHAIKNRDQPCFGETWNSFTTNILKSNLLFHHASVTLPSSSGSFIHPTSDALKASVMLRSWERLVFNLNGHFSKFK